MRLIVLSSNIKKSNIPTGKKVSLRLVLSLEFLLKKALRAAEEPCKYTRG